MTVVSYIERVGAQIREKVMFPSEVKDCKKQLCRLGG